MAAVALAAMFAAVSAAAVTVFMSAATVFTVPAVVPAFSIGVIFEGSGRKAGRGLIRISLDAAVDAYSGFLKGGLGPAAYASAYKGVSAQRG